MGNKKILLTFDYELSLGKRSGSVDNCLIKPTNEILVILKQNGAKAVFFIDTTYLFRLEVLSKSIIQAKEDFNKIKEQLIKIVSSGHYLFHHIHPHWLDAIYIEDINQWSLKNTDRFVLSCLSEQEKEELFKYSHNFLTGIYKQAKINIQCDGFRAGGLYIEPFDCFKPFFDNYGITYDFSVIPGEKKVGKRLFYDFSKCPKDRFYKFEGSISEEKISGKYTEFPITRIKISGFTKILNGVYYRFTRNNIMNKQYGDGLSVGSDINSSKTKKNIMDYVAFRIAISVELLNPFLLSFYKKTFKKNDFVHFLSHPKLVSRKSLICFNKLLQYCNSAFDIEFDFKKMK